MSREFIQEVIKAIVDLYTDLSSFCYECRVRYWECPVKLCPINLLEDLVDKLDKDYFERVAKDFEEYIQRKKEMESNLLNNIRIMEDD